MTKGMKNFVFIVHRKSLAVIFLLPISFFSSGNPIRFPLCGLFLLSLIGFASRARGTYLEALYSLKVRIFAMALLTWVLSAAPFLAMITVEIIVGGTSVVTKAALTHGMSNLVFNVYSDLVAVTILLPLAIIRRKGTPITLSILCKFFLFSLIGSMAQICSFTGLKYASPTLASAIGNLTPLLTYFLAIMMRMEKFDLRSSAGQAISLGAVISVLGASIATLYHCPDILMSSFPAEFHGLRSQQSSWAFGGLLLAATSVLVSIWYIFMTKLVMEFPEKDTVVFFYSFFCTINTGIFTLFMETDPNAWKLRADIELIAILFWGIGGEVISNVVSAWCIRIKGVTYTVMFTPLIIVFSVVMSVVFLGETLHLGSLLGGIVVTLGFYTVMWGKAKTQDMILNCEVDVPNSCLGEAPLLLNNHQDNV